MWPTFKDIYFVTRMTLEKVSVNRNKKKVLRLFRLLRTEYPGQLDFPGLQIANFSAIL